MTTVLGLQNALGPFQGGGIIVLQVRVTDRFGEEAGAAAKDEVWGVRNVCNGMALRVMFSRAVSTSWASMIGAMTLTSGSFGKMIVPSGMA